MLRSVPGTPSRLYDENIRAFVEYKVAQRLLLSSHFTPKWHRQEKGPRLDVLFASFCQYIALFFAPRIHHKGRVLTSSCVISFKGIVQSEFGA